MESNHEQAVARAAELLGPLAARDVPIGPMTTYRVGGSADLFVRLTARDQIPTVATALHVSGLPLLVIGRGSNLLVADAGFRGVALLIADTCNDIEIDAETSTVTAGSGVLLPVLARRIASAGLTGFEWAVGVPGSVGGAVRMNAGGHGSDMSASLISVTLADLADDPNGDIVQSMDVEQLGLRFRGSGLSPTQLIIDATVQLAP
ncbi:MAG: FAD-binding protein, partial [Ilumatobacter sp.]|nr:FAD-binding protein [Ilumatobacter sp.]